MSKKRFILFLIMMLFIPSFYIPIIVKATPILELNSEAAILIDADTKRVLYAKNEHTILYPASMTKVMTMLLALEKANLDDLLVMSDNAINSVPYDSSNIALFSGEQITLRQALYANSIASANEASNGLAEHISGSVDDFAILMTNKAKEIGALNTNFTNANGLHNENHYTTAYDMALIMSYAIKVENYIDITNLQYFEVDPTNIQSETRYLHGMNWTMNKESSYYVEGAKTSKTVFTDQAQSTQVTYASRDGVNLISVVMKADSSLQRYADTQTLLNYGFDSYEIFDVSNLSFNFPEFYIDESLKTDIPNEELIAIDNIFNNILIEKGTSDQIKITYDLPKIINNTHSEGSVIGIVNLYYRDELIDQRNIITIKEIYQEIIITLPKHKKVLIFSMSAIAFSIIILWIIKLIYQYKIKLL